ncbi:MAG: PBP1A family penicillin-binding protein, partial [Alphaproteobacteria bacterium]|nr:PBP1A family penicillin-binding protein [Alphaproteobacteria bacterium]
AVNRPVAFTFLDSGGTVVGHRGAVVGERLRLEDMPPYLPAAFIAMEDRTFYTNQGIDIRGLVRATLANIHAGHVVAGGSTITQQTAKIVFLNPERTFNRKFQELVDAAELAKSLTKKQLLELYLNRIYLGAGAYGVDGAAHVYFNRSARELSLAQAAMLATLTRAPSAFSPRRDLEAAQARADKVLNAMVSTGAITQEQADDASAHPAVISDRSVVDSRNYFLDTAADAALKLATIGGQGPSSDLIVHTTMEPKIQELARSSAVNLIRKQGRRYRMHEAAVIVMKPDGAVSALIGGVDWDESVYNRATQAHRQPGSAFKPFVYLAALEAGLTPQDMRNDQPVDIHGWTPANYGGRSYGTITLAQALAHSVNTITANLAQEVGITTVIDAAQRCGITSPLTANASLALGTSEVTPLELTTAYATFASGGNRVYPYFVTEVDSGGRILYRRNPPTPQRIIASHVNRDLVQMLYGVVTGGTGTAAAIPGHEAAGKTGTTQDNRDAWFVGFTADYVTTVWVGNDHSTPMRGVTGGIWPAQLWHTIMTSVEKDLPSTPLDKSEPGEASGITVASGGTAGLSANDDEASAGTTGPGLPQRSARGGNHSFWNWLFGRSDDSESRSSSDDKASEEPGGSSDDESYDSGNRSDDSEHPSERSDDNSDN